MKIIFVTREGYNLAGARIRAYNFAKELTMLGLRAEVLSYSDDLGAKDGINEGSMGVMEKVRRNIAAYKRLSREKDAVIVVQRVNYHSFAPLFARILKKNRLVLDMDDWEMREDPRYILGFYPTSKAEYLTRKAASLSDFCMVSSLYLKDYISRFNSDVHYIPSCVDTDLFDPNGKTDEGSGVRFAWTGTLHRRDDVENVRFIIDCFEELYPARKGLSLDIVGDGIYRAEVERFIPKSALGQRIRLVGWINPDKISDYLRGVDVGLLPLIQHTRFNMSKSPVKLFEYMAMEKPVVASRIGEAGMVINEGVDGFLAGDKDGFKNSMEILARDSRLRREMGKNARAKIKSEYSLDSAGRKLLSIFTARYLGADFEELKGQKRCKPKQERYVSP